MMFVETSSLQQRVVPGYFSIRGNLYLFQEMRTLYIHDFLCVSLSLRQPTYRPTRDTRIVLL